MKKYNVKNIVNADIFSDVIHKIGKLIVIDKFEDDEKLINSSNELPGEIDLVEVAFLTTCIIKSVCFNC